MILRSDVSTRVRAYRLCNRNKQPSWLYASSFCCLFWPSDKELGNSVSLRVFQPLVSHEAGVAILYFVSMWLCQLRAMHALVIVLWRMGKVRFEFRPFRMEFSFIFFPSLFGPIQFLISLRSIQCVDRWQPMAPRWGRACPSVRMADECICVWCVSLIKRYTASVVCSNNNNNNSNTNYNWTITWHQKRIVSPIHFGCMHSDLFYFVHSIHKLVPLHIERVLW